MWCPAIASKQTDLLSYKFRQKAGSRHHPDLVGGDEILVAGGIDLHRPAGGEPSLEIVQAFARRTAA